MKGNSLNEFMNDLYVNGGPEKEFTYHDQYFIIQCEATTDKSNQVLRLDAYRLQNGEAGDFIRTFFFNGKTLAECVEAFEKAKIFDGKTIYEAEKDIEVLFG